MLIIDIMNSSCRCSGQFQVESDDRSGVNDDKNRKEAAMESSQGHEERGVGKGGRQSAIVRERDEVGVRERDEVGVRERSEESYEEVVSPASLVPQRFLLG